MWEYWVNISYIVRDDDPLVVVDELPVVGGGGVPAVGLTEGDGVAGPTGDVSFHPGDHGVVRPCQYHV